MQITNKHRAQGYGYKNDFNDSLIFKGNKNGCKKKYTK